MTLHAVTRGYAVTRDPPSTASPRSDPATKPSPMPTRLSSPMPRAAAPSPKKVLKAPIPLRQKPVPPPSKSSNKAVKPASPSRKSSEVPKAARAIPKVKALAPATPSHDENAALHQAHEALQREHEALRRDYEALQLKHNDSVHSCLLLLEELKERQPSAEPESMQVPPGRGLGKAPAAGWQRHTWPPGEACSPPQEAELALECPPSPLQRRGGDELYSEEEGEHEEEGGDAYRGDYAHHAYGHPSGGGGAREGGEYYDDEQYGGEHYYDEGEYDEDGDLMSRAEARRVVEELLVQKQLVKDLQAQIGQLTAELSRKGEREGALVIHVSPELW